MFQKKAAKKTKTHIFTLKTFLENRAFYEIRINVLEPARVQMTIWRMRIAW
jgi:hypothetical protein